ncbi:MAG TPA: Ig-like domain-containing protein, partial [Longimicrobiaceae bacterium]|nr:Ig-like domain-containing protein [Longimicrobiaceae bacterium]
LSASFGPGRAVLFTVNATAAAATGVVITPDSAVLTALTDTVRLHAAAADAGGNPVPVAWISLDPGIATVDAQGLVRSLANGTARIVASAGARADTAPVRVAQVATALAAGQQSVTLAPGQGTQLTATTIDARGQPVASSTPLTWTSTNPGVATVSNTGAVTAVAGGTTRVVVASGALSDTVDVTVTGSVSFDFVAAGETGTCALTPAGAAYCWGEPPQSSTIPSGVPAPVGGGIQFETLTVGLDHRCGIAVGGAAYCWGYGLVGQRGNGETSAALIRTPVPVSGGLTFTQIAAGENHTCALATDQRVYCWGHNEFGQLGVGGAVSCGFSNFPCSAIPLQVSGALTFQQIDAHGDVSCGVTTGGAVYCWGFGFGNAPVLVDNSRTYHEVAVGLLHVCARSGTIAYCRGDNRDGQLGTGNGFNQAAFTLVAGGIAFVELDAGHWFTCGRTAAGQVHCWGRNLDFELGNGGVGLESNVPVAVTGGHVFSQISSGRAHSCGVAADGVYCWGGNSARQIGDNTTTNRPAPVKVGGQT